MLWLSSLFTLFLHGLLAASAFQFTSSPSSPTSCDKLSLTWNGGSAPFYLHIVPVFGVPRNISIPSSAFSDNKGSFSVDQLPIAANQDFLLAMSDSSGIFTGGISQVLKAGASTTNAACDTANPSIGFSFQLNSQLQQCSPYTFSGFNGASGAATIMGLIPGGQSVLLNPNPGSASFDWKCNVKQGTSMLFMMVDSQSHQGGSSQMYTVGNSGDQSCLNGQSPSSTPAPTPVPTSGSNGSGNGKNAGKTSQGSKATASASPSAPTSSDKSSSNGGAIAGGVIGSIALVGILGALAFFYIRRRNGAKGWSGGSRPLADAPFAPQYNQYNPPTPSTADTPGSTMPMNRSGAGNPNPFADPPVMQQQPYRSEYSMPQISPYSQPQALSRERSAREGTPQLPSTSQPPSFHQQPPPWSNQQAYPAINHTPSTSPTPSLAPNASPNIIPSQRKAMEAASSKTSPSSSRLMVHTDSEDVEELPPQYLDRRSYAESSISRSSLAYAQDSYN